MKVSKTIPEKIIELLSDHKLHLVKDVLALIGDEQATNNNLHQHINLAKKIAAKMDKEIICQVKGRIHYYRLIWDTDTSPRDMEPF